MPKKLKDRLESEIIRILHSHKFECGCVPATAELLEVVVKAWENGKAAS